MTGLQTITETLVRNDADCSYYRETNISCPYNYGYGQAVEFVNLFYGSAVLGSTVWSGRGGETCSAGIVDAYKLGDAPQDPCDPTGIYGVFYGGNIMPFTWTVS
jgi:hypothetical protein